MISCDIVRIQLRPFSSSPISFQTSENLFSPNRRNQIKPLAANIYFTAGFPLHFAGSAQLSECRAHCDSENCIRSYRAALCVFRGELHESFQAWLLKNSNSRSSHKFHRARMPYKRRSRFWWTFSIPLPGQFFQKRGFFNSHNR